MRKIFLAFLCASACILLSTNALASITNTKLKNKQKLSLLVLDSAGRPRYNYRNLLLMARSVGFEPHYKSLYDFLENPEIQSYDVVFFMISNELLKNIHHVLSQKIITAVENFSTTQGKCLGVFFPGTNNCSPALLKLASQLTQRLTPAQDSVQTTPLSFAQNIKAWFSKPAPSSAILHPFLEHLLQPDAAVGFTFGTTLLNKKELGDKKQTRAVYKQKKRREKLAHFCALPEANVALLPCYSPWQPAITNLLPAGLVIKNKSRNTCSLISKSSLFTFADIEENFFYCPQNSKERTQLLEVAQQVLWEFYQVCHTKELGSPQAHTAAPKLPHKLTTTFIHQQTKLARKRVAQRVKAQSPYAWIVNEGISCGWLAVGDYALSEMDLKQFPEKEKKELKKTALYNGIRFLYDTRINVAWFEVNPEAFLSERSRSPEKEKELREQLEPIAQELLAQQKETGRPLPKVFVGVELTGNFGKNMPPHAVVDLFGTVYPNIPSPLDLTEFWQKELLAVFDVFCDLFEKTIPITGIFIDFEMYHAVKQASLYSDLMDFSNTAWQIYCNARQKTEPSRADTTVTTQNTQSTLDKIAEHETRIAYLVEHARLTNYFHLLEREAYKLGTTIKKHLRTRMPNLLIGAYAPNIPNSWFYRGLLRGLSSPAEPVILATFNTDGSSHYDWLEKQGIYTLNGTALLLSKFRTPHNFTLIDQALLYNNFVWFNKASRIVYDNKKREKSWWAVEGSPLDQDTLAQGIKRARKTIRP